MESLYLILITLFLSCWFLLSTLRDKRYPPGPWRWPLVGNLPQLGRSMPHVVLANLARVHGPLISLRLGTELVVVASSPAAAAEVLKTQDRTLSARFVPHTFRISYYAPYSMAWAVDCDERWKKLRSVCKSELFSVKTLELHSKMREEKVDNLVRSIVQRQGEEVKIAELVFKTVFNILGNVIFSKDVFDLEENEESLSLKSLISRVMVLALAPNVADFYPILSRFDIQGLNRESMGIADRVYSIWETFIKERKQQRDSNPKQDFLSILLSSDFDDLQLKALFTDMFIAGTDTSTTTIEWTLSELIKNPEAMAKARKEVENVVGQRRMGDNIVKETHLVHLNYLHDCIKETLRLHPSAPFLLPRQAVEDCNVMNYVIPKGCRVIVNVWAINRDGAVWTGPGKFRPERFMESGLDYKGSDFEFTPFGAGRRICPGLPLATRMMMLILASLIHNFEWSLPQGMKPEELGMGERFGLVLEREQPLVLIPKPV